MVQNGVFARALLYTVRSSTNAAINVLMEYDYHLLSILTDQRFHSGEALGRQLQVTRSAINQHVRKLEEHGVRIHKVPGRGYRLAYPVVLLDYQKIWQLLSPAVHDSLQSLNILHSVDSTNTHVRHLPPLDNSESCHVTLAEYQSKGRGRQGRTWISPLANNLYMSMQWSLPGRVSELGDLSLCIGIMLARVLEESGVDGIQLKWPNDVYRHGKKLGGILLETQAQHHGDCKLIIGLGLNLRLDQDSAAGQYHQWSDLSDVISFPDRNTFTARVIQKLVLGIQDYLHQGGKRFLDLWPGYDFLYGRILEIPQGKRVYKGTAKGIDKSGYLLLDNDGEEIIIHSGDVHIGAVSDQ